MNFKTDESGHVENCQMQGDTHHCQSDLAQDSDWNVEFFSHREETAWNDFVHMHPRSNIFHTLEWRHVLESVFGYRTVYMLSKGSNGKIAAVLPLAYVSSFLTGRRLVSLPFSQYCGPLWTDEDALVCILSCLDNIRVATRSNYVLLKMKQPLADDVRKRCNLTQVHHYFQSNISLDGTKEQIWHRLHKDSTRWAVRKAERLGVRVQNSERIEDSKYLYELMLKTSKRHGTPSYPPSLFLEIYRSLIPNGLAKVFFATYGNRAI
jgi:hypothetical protein